MIDDLLKATRDERWPEVTELIYRHWIIASQTVYPAQMEHPWDGIVDDDKIANELLYPLAAIFCGESSTVGQSNEAEKQDISLKKLKNIVDISKVKTSRSGQICGRMFKNGEPNYSCKECATDGTCVLCYQCFMNSAHLHHKYKMHTSLGSGYCDCGDKEAWSNDYACKIHIPKDEDEDEQMDADSGLPPQISTRLHRLSLITLKFVVNLLCFDLTVEYPSIINNEYINTERDAYQTILFNDETHTYEGVIRALELAIACTSNQAMRLATIVDREGRAIVRTGTNEICLQVKQSIENRTKKESNRRTQKSGPLVVKVFRSTLSALQSLAVRLLGWMSTQAQEFPPLASIISESLLYGCPNCDVFAPLNRAKEGFLYCLCNCDSRSNAVALMLFDRKLWKAARTAFHQLLMSSVLMDLEHKFIFGRLFVKHYDAIFNDFIDDDHDHSVSITSMTVQIFTVPTIARRLITEEGALRVCMKSLRKYCEKYKTSMNYTGHEHFNFSTNSYPAVLKRALYMLNDVSYLLTLIPKEVEWTDRLRIQFISGSNMFLRFLSDIQGMDEVKRQAVEHQLMESEWETAFNIFLRLQEPLSLLLAWARTDPAVHIQLFRLAMQQILRIKENLIEFKRDRVLVEVNNHNANCIPYEVARQPISVHQPLWRFVGGLFCAPDSILRFYTVNESQREEETSFLCLNFHENIKLPEEPINLHGLLTILMEIPLRILVLNAQAGAAQLWRRNGFSLVNQIHNYSSNLCRTEMFDRDVQLLQTIGALMEPNKFLIRILDRYGLAKWAEFGFEESTHATYLQDRTTLEESSKIFTIIAEEMLHMLIMLLGERYTVGLSDEATPQMVLEREIIHILCTGPKPFSYIEKYVPNEPYIQRLSLENAVRNVGDFKRPTTVTSGQFHLKESLRTEFNPFFWHYSKHWASLAEQQQNKERINLSRDLKACPPPILPRFARFFAPLIKVMESDVFVKLLRVVIERISKRSRFVSEGLFHRTLFLMGMALNEQKRAFDDNKEFKFLTMAQSEDIFTLLERLSDKAEVEVHHDLLWWIIKTYKQVASLYTETKTSDLHHQEKSHTKMITGPSQRSAIAARKRELAMERMRQLQNSFKTQHISLIDSTKTDQFGASQVGGFEDSEEAVLTPDAGFPVCCGPSKSTVKLCRPQQNVMCVLCQEDEVISFDGNPIVCSAFVQNSRLFSEKCTDNDSGIAFFDHTNNGDHLNIFSPINLPQEPHVSTCSHLMHYSCYQLFIDSINSRERMRNRPHLLNARMLNTDSGEYLCPLCKRLSNCVIPVFPSPIYALEELKGFSDDTVKTDPETFAQWVQALSVLVTQPISPTSSNQTKAHSRKRSHSERSLAELTKSAATSGPQAVGVINSADASLAGAGVSPSSVISLPSSFGTIFNETEPVLEVQHPARSSSSISSISDAIVGQIQAIEHNMLNEGSAAIVQQLLTYVFGAKKTSPRGIGQTNVPPFIHHWQILTPLLSALDKLRSNDNDMSFSLMHNNMTLFTRYTEMIDVLKACAFLVRSIASVLEVEKKPLFGACNTRQRDCIYYFVRLSQLISFNCQPSGIRVLLSRLLSPLLALPFEEKNEVGLSEPIPGSSGCRIRKTGGPSILPLPSRVPQNYLEQALRSEVGIMQIDMLSLSVELIFWIGWSWSDGKRVLHNNSTGDAVYKIANGSVDELYVMRLTLLAHLFQIIYSFESPVSSTNAEEKKEPTDFDEIVARLEQLFPLYRWIRNRQAMLDLLNRLHIATIAFLRPLAILYNAITLVPPPEALKDPSLDNFVPLCRYLGLPSTIAELLNGQEVDRLFQMWSEHLLPNKVTHISQLPLMINKLVELPDDFSQLIKMAVNFKCPQVDEMISTIPTLCLSCGEILCSQSYCCQKTINNRNVGACTYHLSRCHGSTGIFLRIRECQIIFLYVTADISRGCFKPAPYVDEFGETDPGFRRGNPMHLNKELYWKIRRQWLHQSVAEEVINQYELNHRNIAFEWQHF